jgi:hypothetical protein
VKRPRKSLQPFPLVIHDCWFAARSLASVRPTVRRARGLAPGSGSLILASVFSFLSSVAPASLTFRGPNSLSLRFISSLCLVVDCQANAVVPRETVHLATRQSYLSRASEPNAARSPLRHTIAMPPGLWRSWCDCIRLLTFGGSFHESWNQTHDPVEQSVAFEFRRMAQSDLPERRPM